MRPTVYVGFAVACFTLPCPAQRCSTLDASAHEVATIRHRLQTVSVVEDDPVVPPTAAADLDRLKEALAAAARAATACTGPADRTEALQNTLAVALGANLPGTAASFPETRGHHDVGAYGSDLAVQVFELAKEPRLLEVSFRFGLECGDDTLLMVFEATAADASAHWHELLRWGAPHYTTVGGALGDFVLLTPMTGSYQHPVWRFVVAHGHPGCGASPRPSRFDLDLLTPAADPAHPAISWHFDRPYVQGEATPRLATTEDTLEFGLVPTPGAATAAAEEASPTAAAEPSQTAGPRTSPTTYSFRMNAQGTLEPMDSPQPPGPAHASVQSR